MRIRRTLLTIASTLILGVMFFAQNAWADPTPDPASVSHNLFSYAVVGVAIVLAIALSIFALRKIRKLQ